MKVSLDAGTVDMFVLGKYWVMINQNQPRNIPWLFNIAMDNGPFIDGLPIKHGDFPWLC